LRQILMSHPHGNANVRQAALAFAESGRLAEFWTGVAWDPDARYARALPSRWRRQFERRAVPEAVRPHLRLHPWREAARLALQQFGAAATPAALSPNACHEDLDRRVARRLLRGGRNRFDGVYAYDHGALETFEAAAAVGVPRLYDLPIGHWRALELTLAEERDRWPEWAMLVPAVDFRSPAYARKDREIALADRLIVPSAFVARTVAEHVRRPPPMTVVPFGAPLPPARDTVSGDRARGKPLRVLYVGAMDLRKGLPYLAAACRELRGSVELTLVGRGGAGCRAWRESFAGARRIESLPHAEVLAAMREADVFAFPTLFEGMALVVLEAMSQGCAVVTTENSGIGDLLEDGVNGFLVPPRSSEALAAVLAALDADRERLAAVRDAARSTGARASWAGYRDALRAAVCGTPRSAAA
jgi:glycosyltransferase involved in cell wall biosynthesis